MNTTNTTNTTKTIPQKQGNKKHEIQKYIALGELTASISGELTHLLQTVENMTEIALKKHQSNESIKKELNEIKTASDLSKNIFLQLLEFSKSGSMSLEKKPANLNDIISDVLLILKSKQHIDFIFNKDESITPINLTFQKVKQVILNMIMNGIDACSENDPVITITTGKLQFFFGFFIKISDNGVGMDKETSDKIFEPFFTTKKTGSGLGLSVCKDIIKDHNGTISVESTKGKGTTFMIKFLFENFTPHPDIIDL